MAHPFSTATDLKIMAGSPPPVQHRVPLERWQVGPWNRWAYQHVRELLPTARVSRGEKPAPALTELPRQLDDVSFDRGNGTMSTLGEYLDASWIDGVAVLQNGALAYERYRNGMHPTSRHLSQSVAKSVLGLLVGALTDRGLLDTATPVTDHVPELARSGYAGATVQHLLDMTAAVDFVEDYSVDFWKYDVACGWHPPLRGSHQAIFDYLQTIGPATWGHGEVMHYVSPNTDLLGIVAERVTGERLAELIARLLWAPLGAEHDADLAVDRAGTAVISGGFCATLRDYARLGQLVLDRGAAVGGTVVPAPCIASLGDGDAEAFGRSSMALSDWEVGGGYHNHWWRLDGRIVARGIHGQLIAVDRDSRIVVVMLSSWPAATDVVEEAGQRSLVNGICTALRDRPSTASCQRAGRRNA